VPDRAWRVETRVVEARRAAGGPLAVIGRFRSALPRAGVGFGTCVSDHASAGTAQVDTSSRDTKECVMSGIDKAKNKAEELGGKGKETVGDATDNRDLQAEGKADQVKGNLKQAGEKVKDAFK
jgi:uncharacterized protein YjbJ (UPF0337 family)